ncbi:MAG TPA: hypothetical protein VJR58_18315 [Vineibacter sp.]|nr:hypothetical protein [Vineibacter sp.]
MSAANALRVYRLIATAVGAIGTVLVIVGAAQAALPPYWQRAREIEAIANSTDVANKLGKAPIDQIDRPSEDLYRVRAGTCTLEVRIVDDATSKEPGWAGPRRFKLDVGNPTCR